MHCDTKLKAHGTTILAVKRNGEVAMAGDGQVTMGNIAVKHTARKIRKLYDGKVLAGFAGAVADALTLFQRFEEKLTEYHGNLRRAAYELARDWRTDRVLRRLEALLVVADVNDLLLIAGSGEIIEPDDGVIGIGSGGGYAEAAARALLKFTELDAATIAHEALAIASRLCIYTNNQVVVEKLP
ncbi:MAG: ATP-dependent protease subunit HslV [Armatimonadota bacterium]|nr:ATP-dependent protease subunit HslV [Armatimonadota bacterium]MCX7776656.1 ATP-dependent protease subunit HslV [Armatimonadota bacterium]MDW8025729.1 ATP-dependent protease subunit HslV [Armatimonadota bacterium]